MYKLSCLLILVLLFQNILQIGNHGYPSMMFCFQILIIWIIIWHSILTYFKTSYSYWKRKNVPFLKPNIPFGNFGKPQFREGMNLVTYGLYKKFKKSGAKYFGTYIVTNPILHIIDPNLIKLILTTHSNHFTNRGMLADEKNDPLNCHLFNLDNAEWKDMRRKLTPTFTSAKMKMMFPTLLDCTSAFVKHFDQANGQIDLIDITGCFTTDVIASCVFGIECNSIVDRDNEFRKYGRLIIKPRLVLRRLLLMFAPSLVKQLKMTALTKDVNDFFLRTFTDIIVHRETTGVRRNDFIQILTDMKQKDDVDAITYQQMCAQCLVFFAAGFETSSITMTYCFHELAHNQDIQDKLMNEIREVTGRYDGLTYDGLMQMKYLDNVISETLRKYPPGPVIRRQCTETYTLPDGTVIDKGTKLLISVLGLHRDEEHFPKPDIFNPDRFSEENKSTVAPSVYIPFGDGQRVCIGQRFGLMQVKAGITSVLMKCRILPDEKTSYHVEFKKQAFVLQPSEPLCIRTELRLPSSK